MDFDFLVLGGGSAGYAAARTAAGLGLKTAVVEGGRDVGGLCILRGCMPSKTLIESANRFQTLRQAAEFGLSAEGIAFDAAAIIARKKRLIGEFADYRREQLETGNFAFLRGHAKFRDPHTVVIRAPDGTESTVTARTFLLATGSEIAWPDVPGLAEAGCLTSDDVLDLTEIPPSIVVLGAGPVALEMAHYFNALGSAVTVVQRSPQVLRGVDADVAQVVEDAFRRKGAQVFTGTRLKVVRRHGNWREVVFEQGGQEITLAAGAVLNALGRRARTDDLGLADAGIGAVSGPVPTNAFQQTAQPHIFAAGDCCGPFEVVHIAIEQGELAARNAARVLAGDPALQGMDYRLKLYAVFTEPQVAAVGLTEAEALAAGRNILTASYPFRDHGKSLVMNEVDGFVKLLVDAGTREIIGGAVVGPHASDLIHEVVVAMRFHATAGQLATTPHYHPTLSEIWTYPAEELAG
jgi:pyruvate/2-oxoglutarate dehydrogenase complex dihydrolipoamide dehydrogenase (E3) component